MIVWLTVMGTITIMCIDNIVLEFYEKQLLLKLYYNFVT